MAYLIIQPMQVADTNFTGSTATLRIFASAAFYEASTSEYIPVGRVNDLNSAYQSIACTVSSGTVTIPAVTLATTTDSNVPNVKYTAVLYSATNRKYVFLSNFFVDPEFLQSPAQSSVLVQDAGSSAANAYYTYRQQSAGYNAYNVREQADSATLYALVNTGSQWRIYNSVGTNLYHTSNNPDEAWDGTWVTGAGSSGSAPVPTVSEYTLLQTGTWEQLTISNQAFGSPGAPFQFNSPFWNVQQTKDYIDSVIGSGTATPYASRLIVGKTALDEDPVLSTQPIAVAINSNRINRVLSEDYDDMVDAITTIGSTPTVLVVKEDATVSTALTIPATLYLQFEQGAVLTKTASGTINFNGMGLIDPESQIPIFSGFAAGDIVWDGATFPRRISSSLWANDDWDARVIRACNAFTPTTDVTIVVYPGGSLTTQVEVFEGQRIYFTTGDYTNDGTGADTAGIIVNANTEIYGDGMGQTRIQEPPTVSNIKIIYGKSVTTGGFDGVNDNIRIHDFTVYGNAVHRSNSERSAIFLGQGKNLHIYRVEADHIHGFFAYVGGFGTAGNYPDGWSITDCVSRGAVSQTIGCIIGKDGIIARNQFLDIQPILLSVIDGVTNSTTTVTSATANFDPAMIQSVIRITKPGQANFETSIFAVTNPTTIVLNGAVPFSASGCGIELTGAFAAIIDLEPNTPDTYLENIIIADNIFDGTHAHQFYHGIVAQAGAMTAMNNVSINNNIIIGAEVGDNVFYATAVNTGANTITIPSHQLETGMMVIPSAISGAVPTGLVDGQTYSAIRIDNDTIQIAWSYAYAVAATPIDITNAGSGYSRLIGVSALSTGILVEGGFNCSVTENTIQKATAGGFAVYNSADLVVHGNKLLNCGGGGNPGAIVEACVDSSIDYNILHTSPIGGGSTSADVTEDEYGPVSCNTSGTTVTTVSGGLLFRRWWAGRTVTINAVDYTVQAVIDIREMVLTTSAGTQTGVNLTTKFSDNTYKDNQWGTLTLSSVGTSVVYSNYTDIVAAAPATTTDNAIVRWNGTTGRAIQNSTVIVEDNNVLRTGVNLVGGYASTATAAGTTTLTVASTGTQVFTGATTQTVTLPVVTTLFQAGLTYRIINRSTGLVTVNSSGGNAVIVLGAGTTAYVTNNKITADTTAAAWDTTYVGTSTASGKVATFSNSITYAGTDGTTMTFPGVSASVAPLVSPSFTTPALGVATGTSLTATGLIKSSSPTAGIGYATGAGGTQTQLTSKVTAFTLDAICGKITFAADQLDAGETNSATWTNSAIAATDVVAFSHLSGGTIGAYTFNAQCGGGTATINITNQSAGNLSEAPVVSFVVIKAVTS